MAYLPRLASYDERMGALAKRLGYMVPPDPTKLTARQWIRLWAWVGTELAGRVARRRHYRLMSRKPPFGSGASEKRNRPG
jgi:hypothetical protein